MGVYLELLLMHLPLPSQKGIQVRGCIQRCTGSHRAHYLCLLLWAQSIQLQHHQVLHQGLLRVKALQHLVKPSNRPATALLLLVLLGRRTQLDALQLLPLGGVTPLVLLLQQRVLLLLLAALVALCTAAQ